MPEVALPTLAILFETEHPFPVEIVNLVVELIPGTLLVMNSE